MVESVAFHRAPNRSAVIRLLESAQLPTEDLTDAHMQNFFCVGSTTAPHGIVGVEFHGDDALLRSLFVSPEFRVMGLGRSLVECAENHAREQGATSMYLLTTTAERFFQSRGYVTATRESAPPAIRSTAEFSTLCPGSAAFLSKQL